jgi:hypothetical protein
MKSLYLYIYNMIQNMKGFNNILTYSKNEEYWIIVLHITTIVNTQEH